MEKKPDDGAGLGLPASAVRKVLLGLRVPRLMADHAAALLDANLRRRPRPRKGRRSSRRE